MSPPAFLLDALETEAAPSALRELDDGGKLAQLLPELDAGRDFKQPELHYYAVLDHMFATVAALEAATGAGDDGTELREAIAWADLDENLARRIEGVTIRSLLRLACLVHDIAKPATATEVDGRLRFPRHGPRGAEILAERLPAAGFGPRATDFVCRMVRYHLRPGVLVRGWPPTDRAVQRFVADVDGHVLPLLLLNLSDGMATRGPGYTRENFRRHLNFLNYVLARSTAVFEDEEEAVLNGHDLITELGMEGGRLLGAVLTSVRRAQTEGRIANRDEALALARFRLDELTRTPANPRDGR